MKALLLLHTLGEPMKLTLMILVSTFSLLAFARPNPLAIFCEKEGGKYEQVFAPNGAFGLCSFGAGKIGAKAFYEYAQGKAPLAVHSFFEGGECGKEAVVKYENGADVSVCEFSDGTVIEAQTLARGAKAKANAKLSRALKWL
jgi:putative hemolysin